MSGYEWRVTWRTDAGSLGVITPEAIYQNELAAYRHAARLRTRPRIHDNIRVERRVVGPWIGDNELDFEDDGTPWAVPVPVGEYL